MTFKEFLIRTFTWWNGTTWGTHVYTWRRGGFVGEDEFGNRYYEAKGALIDPSVGPRRRWVVYNGEIDPSKVPPGWRGWLAFTAEIAPSQELYQPRPWQLPHLPNRTGTPAGLSSAGLDPARGRAPGGDRRLCAVDAGRRAGANRAERALAASRPAEAFRSRLRPERVGRVPRQLTGAISACLDKDGKLTLAGRDGRHDDPSPNRACRGRS